MLTTSAVVCISCLCCVRLVQDSLVDQPQAEGTFPVQTKLYLSNILSNSHLSVQEGGRLLGLFSHQRKLFLFIEIPQNISPLSISTKPEKNCLTDHAGATGFFYFSKLSCFSV